MRRHLALAAVLLAAACSGQSEQAKVSGTVVDLKLLAFAPGNLTVKAGTTVTWRNAEPITHTVTSGAVHGIDPKTGLRADAQPDGLFDHRLGGEGATFAFTFSRPGTYSYFCSIHQGMNATVVVTA
jgi:plastocyanin